MKHSTFTIFPAIDLRSGQVVRLQQGDPDRQTVYGRDPGAVARHWMAAGAVWLHVVNLDGAFGEKDQANRRALAEILRAAGESGVRVQFGGGLRSTDDIRAVIEAGVDRIVLGTLVVENPEILQQAIETYGPERVAAGVDARSGLVRIRGWQEGTAVRAVDLAARLQQFGLRWLIFTDVARDGLGSGLNLPATVEIARETGLQVIASGGVKQLKDLEEAREAGLAGAIVGRALYEGDISLEEFRAALTQPGDDSI